MGYITNKLVTKPILNIPSIVSPTIKTGGFIANKIFGTTQLATEEPTERKVSTFQKVLGLLQRGETAPFVMKLLQGEGLDEASKEYFTTTFGKEPERRTTYSDVLGEIGLKVDENDPKFYQVTDRIFFGLTGLIGDIFLDPKTYLTAGIGGATKIIGKVGGKTVKVAVSKAGKKILQKAIPKATKEIGEELLKKGIKKTASEIAEAGYKRATREFLQEVSKKGGEKLIAFGGFKFMGKPILPSVQKMIGKTIKKGFQKIPLVKKPISFIEKAFVPFSEIKKMPEALQGQKYVDEFNKMIKITRAEEAMRVTDVVELGKAAKKAIPKKKFLGIAIGPKPKIGEIISEAIETGERTGVKVLDDIVDFAGIRHSTIAAEEMKRGLLKTELPEYLRHFLTKEGRKFIDKGGSLSQLLQYSKPIRVKLGAAKGRKLTKTISEINEMMTPIMKKSGIKGNFFEPDFFKAFSGREIEHIKARNTYDFFSDISRSIGKSTDSKSLIEDGIRYMDTGIPELKGIAFPEPIVKHLNQTYDFIIKEDTAKGFLGLYDKLLAFWKGTVTGVWPAFHARNLQGGIFNNWLAGVKSPTEYIRAEKIIKGGAGEITTTFGQKYTYKQIRKLVEDLGVTGQPGMIDVMRTVDDLIAKKKITQIPRDAMEAIENRLRMPLFVNKLIKGNTPAEAAQQVFKFHFDYAPEALTSFERNVLRRFIPFYRWTRGNVPLQISQLIQQPGKFAAVAKIKRDFNKLSDEQTVMNEEKYFPDWMREMLTFRLPMEEKSYWLQLDLPMEDMAKLPITEEGTRSLVSMLSPILKYPIEVIANRNIFFQSDIVDKDLPPEMQTRSVSKHLKVLPEPIKKWLNFKDGIKLNKKTNKFEPYFEMDSKKLHAMQTFFGRFYSTFQQALSEELPWWATLSRLVGGIPIREINAEELKAASESRETYKEQKEATYLKQRGLLPYKGKGYPKSPLLEEKKETNILLK